LQYLAHHAQENKTLGINLNYANGPIAAVFSYNNTDGTYTLKDAAGLYFGAVGGYASTENDNSSWLLGGSYDFGVVKVFGQWFDGERSDKTFTNAAVTFAKTNTDMNGWELGIHVPVTAQITLAGTYFDTSWDSKAVTAAGGVTRKDGDGNGYQLAALYSLSKRTTAYMMYGSEDMDTDTKASIAKEKADATQWAIGLKHTF
jgi:predicted porin